MSDPERSASGSPEASSGAVAAGTLDTRPRPARSGGGPAPRRALARRLAGPGLAAAAAITLFACYLRMSSTVATNSDGASNALQAWDMLHGNLLLHGWWLSDVSFYTTELPEYMLVELVHGLNADVVHIGAALTYTLLVVLAALLAKGRATGREAWVRVLIAGGLMLAPQLGVGTQVLLLSPDHVGTSVPVLLAWLLLDRFGRRRWVPAAVALLLAWALAADDLVLFIGIAPLLLVSLVRAYRRIIAQRRRPSQAWYELSLAAAALAALAVGLAVPALLHAAGGYSVVPVPEHLALASQLGTRLRLTAEGLLLLFGADFIGIGAGLSAALLVLHLAGVALAVWAVCIAVRRFLSEDDLIAALLVAGTLIIVAAYLLWRQVPGIGYSHEMAPALPFAAVLAGRLLAGRLASARLLPARLLRARLLPVAAAVLLGYALTLGGNALHRPAPDTDPQLTSFLAGHHLSYGLSGYWQADAITLASGDAVAVRALQVNGAGLSASHWESNASWYDPRRHDATFVLLFSGQPGFAGQAGLSAFDPAAQVAATFGRPALTYHVGRYTVLVWHQNLLRRLS
jgi:hypothetical protein